MTQSGHSNYSIDPVDQQDLIESDEEESLLPSSLRNKSKRGNRRNSTRRSKAFFIDTDKDLTRIIILIIILIVISIICLTTLLLVKSGYKVGADLGRSKNPHYLIKAENGAVATELSICSEIGVDILKDGGSAIDATIAALLCVGTINGFATGIGGGGFGIIKSHQEDEAIVIDFREEAPSSSHKNMFVDNPKSAQIGPKSVGVPGEVEGMRVAHEMYGILPWKKLFEPSIKLAREGFEVPPELAKRLIQIGEEFFKDPIWADIYTNNGTLKSVGDIIVRSSYADTLEAISNDPSVFYNGYIAESIVHFINEKQGNISMTDFKSYRAKVKPAISSFYHGKKIWTTPAPTSGPSLIAMLNILEGYPINLREMNTLNYHHLIEAEKYGYAFRTELSDPDYINNSIRIQEFLNKDYAMAVRANISDFKTFPIDHYNPRFDIKDTHGTTHISVIDKNGSVAAFTSTINLVFGSGLLEPTTGIILNDEMDDFSIPGIPNAFDLYPSPYNFPKGGKRPLSSSAPAIVMQASGHPLAVGAAGGSRILTAILQVILNVVDRGMDLSAAVEEPRIHCQLLPSFVSIESGLERQQEIIRGLEERGHNVTLFDINQGSSNVQIVAKWWDNQFHAASDSRRHGVASGY